MSEMSWMKGLDDAANGVHQEGQGEDYERGWEYGQLPDYGPIFEPEPVEPFVPEGCIEVIDEREES